MITSPFQIDDLDLKKILGTGSGDAALLYLYIRSGNEPDRAEQELNMTATRYGCASATLRQLGLWPQEVKKHLLTGERPNYSEQDVLRAMDSDMDFRSLYGETVEDVCTYFGYTLGNNYLGKSRAIIEG